MYEGLRDGCVSINEAEVGTGKSMAYLVAGFMAKKALKYGDNPVTIATSSIELQKALVEKEIPRLSNMLYTFGLIDQPLTRICADFQKRHGIRHLKLHGLRHTCGSLMVEHGTDPETVKAVLGHESIKTTNRYLHPYEDGMRKASGTMESIIRGVANDKTTVCASGSA